MDSSPRILHVDVPQNMGFQPLLSYRDWFISVNNRLVATSAGRLALTLNAYRASDGFTRSFELSTELSSNDLDAVEAESCGSMCPLSGRALFKKGGLKKHTTDCEYYLLTFL